MSSAKSAKPVNSTFYPNTRAVDFAVSSNKKPMLQLQFETGGRRIDFTLGSHLIHGSLVILFETNSQQAPIPDSAMYAVVEEFDLRQATHRNVVGVSFLDPDDLGRFSISKKQHGVKRVEFMFLQLFLYAVEVMTKNKLQHAPSTKRL